MKLSRQISLFCLLCLFASISFAETVSDADVTITGAPLGADEPEIQETIEPKVQKPIEPETQKAAKPEAQKITEPEAQKTVESEAQKSAESNTPVVPAVSQKEEATTPAKAIDAVKSEKNKTAVASDTAVTKKFSKNMTEAELKEQDKLLKQQVLEFVKDNQDRQSGEGWIFIARNYFELKQYDRALKELDTLIRSEEINPRMIWEAKLLADEIYKETKQYDIALKNLDKLINQDKPARIYLVRAKIARAELLSRNLTGMKELLEAFRKYYWYFPEKKDLEAIEYLMGFQKGYDLEIAMQAMEAWEEIAKFPEVEASNLANMHLAMLFAFDLNNPERSFEFLNKIRDDKSLASEVKFIRAVIGHFYTKQIDVKATDDFYTDYCLSTNDLDGYRTACILHGQFLSEKAQNYEGAVNAYQSILTLPSRLIASDSVSINKQREESDEQIDWSMLACRMAAFVCEYKLENTDRARAFYLKVKELNSARSDEKKDPVNEAALKRTEPSKTPGEAMFAMAYEKYRSQNFKDAVNLYNQFIKKYPDSPLFKEALFRVATIMDDDLRRYDEARAMYEYYIIQFKPVESNWKLDKIYDWGRVDEARYRIGCLLYLHLNKPVEALDTFKQLAEIYPESYWAKQGLRDSVKIYQDEVQDPNKANALMKDFIKRYPDSDEAADYRLTLYKIALGKGEDVEALYIIRDWLDHRLPSEKNYFAYKQQWRDLVFKIREANLRDRLKSVGDLDRVGVYQSLIDVVALASTSAPLQGLITEIKGLEIKDEYRWALAYDAGTRLYTDNPEAAHDLFVELAGTATGSPKIACMLTLGNIAYRVKKDADEAVKWYEAVEKLLPLTDPMNEIPAYRLGRLYLKNGHGIKGLEKLRKFISRFPNSRYVGKAYMAMGDACVALYSPEKAARYYSRVSRIAPNLVEEVNKKIAGLEGKLTSEQWLKQRAGKNKDQDIEKAVAEEDELAQYDQAMTEAADKIKNVEELEENDLKRIDSEVLYGLFLKENRSKKPDADRMTMFLSAILTRSTIPAGIRDRALKQFISTRYFRYKDADSFIEVAKKILLKHNYADWLSELLYKLAQCQDYQAKDYEGANKSYFEYTSFYPTGKHFIDVRSRIPEVYELAEDSKNAIRFYLKLIDDENVPDENRIRASMNLAKLYLTDDNKTDAIKTYEVALGMKTDRKPEICLRLEKLTDDFSYVQRALESEGDEGYRLKALKRLIKKNEEDGKFIDAKSTLASFANTFTEPESTVYIEKKAEDLAKRGAIADMEDLIDQYPEEPETPGRMFKLAKMVEGTENTKYRAEDLFYEITLVYPDSEFFKESQIRADNSRAIKASSELSEMLKKGNKPSESEEIVLERARLLKENMKDLSGALENYESFIKLFPNSKHLDEVYIVLGDLALSENHDSEKAFKYWELGMQASVDPFNRETLTERINSLRTFNTRVIDSGNAEDHEKGLKSVFVVWKMERNHLLALGMLRNAYSKVENKPQAALLHYYAGRILEENKKFKEAQSEYEDSLKCLYHPGCRYDMVIYRIARMLAANDEKDEAAKWYNKLVAKYPRSLLSRSGYYWLSKYYDERKELTKAYENLEKLITGFKSLNPIHRIELEKKLKDLGGRMNISEMERLKGYSKIGGGELPYYIGKVLQNDLQDPDKAISQYEEFLKGNPPVSRGREVMTKIAELYESKGDFVKAVGYYDMLLSTYEPTANNYDLILHVGTLLEHKIGNDTLTELFYSSIEGEYHRVRKVREFASAKLRRLEEKRIKLASTKPSKKKVIKREYSEDDQDVLDELKEIIEKYVDDLQDFKMAERKMEDLWDENSESLATLDIMKALVKLNIETLLDNDKAAKYYAKWLEENENDPLYKEYVLKLYDHYNDVMKDGNKALRLLEDYTREHPISLETLDIELKLAKTNETRLRNYAEALRSYQRIIDTRQNEPTVHEAYFRMGFVYRDGYANYTEAINSWQTLINDFYNNDFSDQAQYAIAYTYECYVKDYTKARAAYNDVLNRYPNSSLQNDVRNAILRIEGK